MPLAFSSLSHGTVAFGFYNVETDGLLLDRFFFFCTDFCRAASQLEELRFQNERCVAVPGFRFEEPERIGDLHGAIEGVRHGGYLGEVYRRWPFPSRPEEFRQRLHGARNRGAVEDLLRRWAPPFEIPIAFSASEERYRIGPYVFSEGQYAALLASVLRGGYPTWEGFEEGLCPAYVANLGRAAGGLLRRLAGPARGPATQTAGGGPI
jgi:hypothetical protein